MRIGTLFVVLLSATLAMAQDIIVKKDGAILNVYHLEEGSNVYYYSLESGDDAQTFKINKDDVFSVKKSTEQAKAQASNMAAAAAPAVHRQPVTALLSSDFKGAKKGATLLARTPDGHELNFSVLSDSEKTLAVIMGKYNETSYVIPEYVDVQGVTYTVTEVADKAFYNIQQLNDIQFPSTLKKIGRDVFFMTQLQRIILPESLEELGAKAFFCVGWKLLGILPTASSPVNEIYIPKSIKVIGKNCFFSCGNMLSPGKKCEAYFSSMPDFITEETCDTYGIDDSAVKAFRSRK